MPPPLPIYPLSALESQINTHPDGKARKPPTTNLIDCPLKELVQYKCNISLSKTKGVQPTIMCEPVVRLLRQCENGVSVETTAWERWKASEQGGGVEKR